MIFPSATASFNFSVNIEVIVEIRSSVGMPLDSATSLSVAPSLIPVAMSAFSIPVTYIPATLPTQPLTLWSWPLPGFWSRGLFTIC